MIVEKIVRRCPRCESERLRKNGHTDYRAQRAQCRACGKTFVLANKPARYSQAERERILSAHVRERLSMRATTRLFGVAYGTLKGWLEKKAEAAPALEDTLLPWQKGDVLELDELGSFVPAKWKQGWLWLAICRRTRQIVAYTLGERSEISARFLRESIPRDYARAATRSDLWESYQRVFGANLNGQRRRTHRSCPKQAGETNHVERFNGTLRSRASRFVRRSYSFSKREETHAQAFHLFAVAHNLEIMRQHAL